MCKRKALEMVASENPPRKDDSRKTGYIELMKQLWEESGYQNQVFAVRKTSRKFCKYHFRRVIA